MMYKSSMTSREEFAEHYRKMSDEQLENLASESGFTEAASQALHEELSCRKIHPQQLHKAKLQVERHKLRDEAKERTFPLFRRGGIGVYFYGRNYLSEADKAADIQIRTKWFVICCVPLVPIASYRFKCNESDAGFLHWDAEQKVVNRVPLNWNQIAITYLKTIAVTACLVAAFWLFIHYKSQK
jgi:hypothetical protein